MSDHDGHTINLGPSTRGEVLPRSDHDDLLARAGAVLSSIYDPDLYGLIEDLAKEADALRAVEADLAALRRVFRHVHDTLAAEGYSALNMREWEDGDWADSGWTDAEAESIRNALKETQ